MRVLCALLKTYALEMHRKRAGTGEGLLPQERARQKETRQTWVQGGYKPTHPCARGAADGCMVETK